MKKLILHMYMSLDGYIADTDDNTDWIKNYGQNINSLSNYTNFLENIDTIVLGWNTYNQIVTSSANNKWPYEDFETYVFTQRSVDDAAKLTFLNNKLPPFIQNLKDEKGKNIWVYGGRKTIKQLVDNDLIDTYIISIIPIILGDGLRLFDKVNKSYALNLVKSTTINGIIELEYERLR